jgi:hypothetical protein
MKIFAQALLCTLVLGLAACAPEENSGGGSKKKTIFDEKSVEIQSLSTPDSAYGLFQGPSENEWSATIHSRIKITDRHLYQAAHCEFTDGTSVFAQVRVEAVVDEGNQTIEVLESAEKTQRRKKDGMQYSCIVRVSAGSRFYSINDGVMSLQFSVLHKA